MLFTAIALVAFAGTSMGNTKETGKRINPVKKTKKQSKEVIYPQDYCDRVWVRAANFHMATGDDMWEAMDNADFAEKACRSNPETQNLP